MANPVQWTVDQLYNEIRKLDAAGRAARAQLNAQKQRLQDDYTQARNASDQARMTFLQPLIHRNSELRIQGNEYAAKFNDLVARASALFKAAGLNVPETLSGLALAPALIIVPATLVALVLVAWGIVNSMNAGRAAIDSVLTKQGPALITIASDPARTPEERKAAQDAYNKLLEEAGARGKDDWVKTLVPILGLVLAIVVAPTVLKMLPGGKRAAA